MDKIIQKFDENLSSGLNLSPETIEGYSIDNEVKRGVAYLMAYNPASESYVRVNATADGSLNTVSEQLTGEVLKVESGLLVRGETYAFNLGGLYRAFRVDCPLASIMVSISADGVVYSDEIFVEYGRLFSARMPVQKVKAFNLGYEGDAIVGVGAWR